MTLHQRIKYALEVRSETDEINEQRAAALMAIILTSAEVRERERAAAANAWFECWRCHGYYSGQTDDEMRAEGKRWAEDWYTRRYGGEA